MRDGGSGGVAAGGDVEQVADLMLEWVEFGFEGLDEPLRGTASRAW